MKKESSGSPLALYRHLSRLGINTGTSEKFVRYILLTNNIILTTLTLIPPYAVLFYAVGMHFLALALIGVFLMFIYFLYLTSQGKFFISRLLTVLSLNTILGIYAIAMGRESGIHFLYFVFFTLPFLLFDLK